jgi:hypothetical protein
MKRPRTGYCPVAYRKDRERPANRCRRRDTLVGNPVRTVPIRVRTRYELTSLEVNREAFTN